MELRNVASAQRARILAIVGMVLAMACGIPAAANAATAISSYTVQGGVTFGNSGPAWVDGASDLAVSPATGNIFIGEYFTTAGVAVYSPDPAAGGTPLISIDSLGQAGLGAQSLAVDPVSDAVYVSDSFIGTGIARFLSDGNPTPTYTLDSTFTPTGIGAPAGVAVDPVTHDLLVVDRGANPTRVIRLAAADGHEVSSIDGSNTTGGGFQGARSVAVGSTGTIYVSDPVGKRVERFSSAGASLGKLDLPVDAVPSAITTNAVGDVAVAVARRNQLYVIAFTAAGTQRFSVRATATGVAFPVTGLGWNSGLGRFYISRSDGSMTTLVPGLQPGLDAPTATTGRNTATVSAEVAPGGETTNARLEYCPSTSACGDFPISADPNAAPDPTNPWVRGPEHSNLTATTTITDDLPLNSNATWRVRVSAENTVSGTDNTSAIANVNTPLLMPGVTTGPAGSVTDAQAELNGTIDTLAAPTTYHFEYGLTSNYGSRVPVSTEASAGNNRTPRTVSRIITGLQAGTTYHFRLVAKNAVGEAAGADRTFTTAGADEVAPNRGYEQVTPVDKHGAQVLSDTHVHAAGDGSAIAVTTVAASRDASAAHIVQNNLARRGSNGWLDWQGIDPPQNAAPGLLEASTLAVSADFNHALVASNRALAPGGITGGGNLYIKDLRIGDYRLVAAAAGNLAYGRLVGIQLNERIFLGAAPDFSWIEFYGEPLFAPTATAPAIYRWTQSTGELRIDSLLPDNTVPPYPALGPSAFKNTLPSVSTDGSVVGFALASGIYRRAGGQITAVSVSRIAGDPPDAQPGAFDGITPDGRYVFFHTYTRLTDDTPALAGVLDALYRYDSATDELRFLSTTIPSSPTAIYGFSDDGQTVYADDGSKTVVWRDGQVRTVSTADRPILATQFEVSTGVTPSGRYFAWVGADGSARIYDAERDETQCASCLPDGSPSGDAHMMASGRTISNRRLQMVTESGTVFFDTAKRLTTADHNGARDVYSFRNGRTTLLSPGDGDFDAFFVDASTDGSSVFFQTDEGLVSQDVDGESDIYVARVGGGFAGQNPPSPPAPCVRAECGEIAGGPVASAPAPSSSTGSAGGGAKRTNQERVRISLSRVSFGSKTVKITFQANQRGRIRVSGSRVTTTIRDVAKSGTYSVSVPLSKKARALRRAHKKVKVSLRVSLSGGWGSASAKYSRTLGK